MLWVWISDITGMPLAVQKCDFEPNINHAYNGKWVGVTPEQGNQALRERIAFLEQQIITAMPFEKITKEQRERIAKLERVREAAQAVADSLEDDCPWARLYEALKESEVAGE